MNIKYIFGFMTLVLLMNTGIVSSLTCYECTQPKGQGLVCETNVETVRQTVCPEGSTTCVKYIWTTTGSSVISRHCAASDYCDLLSKNSTSFNNLELCKSCNIDLCNSGAILRSTALWTCVAYIIAKIFN